MKELFYEKIFQILDKLFIQLLLKIILKQK